ncbi:hypothetical protein [Faecalibacter rhinopitheci]|uniref:Uncharacterized protein n=1 Tax=Faecalibacter rhinopitheci TaxID=2779678 RepID=A0A8J7FRD9_9FLAO|nr:hypothetical protein [Faecalibacter rhinopitheci]MBF0598194.1 hypothetical protein [Faecalibacter rhinopitheci]
MEFKSTILHPIYDPINDEVDVIVHIESHYTKFHVTFITYKRAQEIFKENSLSIFTNTLFVERLTKENIHCAIKYVIDERLYLSIFYPINEQARIALFSKLAQEKEINE